MRLIDADSLFEKLDENSWYDNADRDIAEDLVLSAPTIAALRGPTREQVEKVWKGEWINKHSVYDHKIFTCAQCGKQISIQGENLDFCPKCGSAQTDEAVEIVMKRLEEERWLD